MKLKTTACSALWEVPLTQVSARHVRLARDLWMAAVGVRSVQRERNPMKVKSTAWSVLREAPLP